MSDTTWHWGYVLDAPNSLLHGHIFRGFSEAARWLAQPYLAGKRFRIRPCMFRRRKCCGEPFSIKRGVVVLGDEQGAAR